MTPGRSPVCRFDEVGVAKPSNLGAEAASRRRDRQPLPRHPQPRTRGLDVPKSPQRPGCLRYLRRGGSQPEHQWPRLFKRGLLGEHVSLPASAKTYVERLGARRVFLAVVVAPIAAAALTAGLSPRLVAADYEASARIELYPITGLHATYEAASVTADFAAAYADLGKRAGVQADPSEPTPTLGSSTPSDSSVVIVTYTASSEDAAERGLHIAATAAALSVAAQEEARASASLTAAQEALDQARKLAGAGQGSVLQAASQNYADALLKNAVAEVSRRSVSDTVQATPVTVTQLSTLTGQLRAVAVAVVSAFVAGTLVLFALMRSHTASTPPSVLPARGYAADARVRGAP